MRASADVVDFWVKPSRLGDMTLTGDVNWGEGGVFVIKTTPQQQAVVLPCVLNCSTRQLKFYLRICSDF